MTMSNQDAGELYRRLAPRVLGYLRAHGALDPEDVLGEVFHQVARDVRRVRGDDEAVRRWVFTVARNRLIDDHRRRAARPQRADAPIPDLPAPTLAPTDLDPELQAALRALTPEQREVVVLRFVADLSLQDVARITRRRVGAVKSLQARALDNLARTVSPGVSVLV